jgi:hypothetical protein
MMSEWGTVTPIASRRTSTARHPVPPAEETLSSRPARVFMLALVALCLLLVAGVLSLTGEQRDRRQLVDLPEATRAQLYTQVLSEVQSVCREVEAASGPLRDHCVGQARFVTLFPECDSACRRAAYVVIPHAHR